MTRKRRLCLVSALPPFRSGVSLYTKGLLSGFESVQVPFPIVVVANRSARGLKTEEGNVKLLKTWTKGPRYLWQVISTLIKQRPALVHFQHEFFLYGGAVTSLFFPLLLLITRMMGAKVVVTMHGVVPQRLAGKQFAEAFFVPTNSIALRVGLAALTKLIAANAHSIIVHSRSAKTILHEDYGVSLVKIRVIPHGVDVSVSASPPDLAQENNVLFFGNITPSKGLDMLIRAFEHVRVPTAKLIIAGGPHPRDSHFFGRITKMARTSPISDRIKMVGYVPDEQISTLFRQSCLAVFPYTISVSSSGGLSFAMAHGKPVVVTDLPAFNEVIKNNLNGIVVPLGDVQALASAIERILSDQDLRSSLSQEMNKSASEFSWPATAEATSEFYQTLLAHASQGSPRV